MVAAQATDDPLIAAKATAGRHGGRRQPAAHVAQPGVGGIEQLAAEAPGPGEDPISTNIGTTLSE